MSARRTNLCASVGFAFSFIFFRNLDTKLERPFFMESNSNMTSCIGILASAIVHVCFPVIHPLAECCEDHAMVHFVGGTVVQVVALGSIPFTNSSRPLPTFPEVLYGIGEVIYFIPVLKAFATRTMEMAISTDGYQSRRRVVQVRFSY